MQIQTEFFKIKPTLYCIDPPNCKDRDDAIFCYTAGPNYNLCGICIAVPDGSMLCDSMNMMNNINSEFGVNQNLGWKTIYDDIGNIVHSIWQDTDKVLAKYSLKNGSPAIVYARREYFDGLTPSEVSIFLVEKLTNVIELTKTPMENVLKTATGNYFEYPADLRSFWSFQWDIKQDIRFSLLTKNLEWSDYSYTNQPFTQDYDTPPIDYATRTIITYFKENMIVLINHTFDVNGVSHDYYPGLAPLRNWTDKIYVDKIRALLKDSSVNWVESDYDDVSTTDGDPDW